MDNVLDYIDTFLPMDDRAKDEQLAMVALLAHNQMLFEFGMIPTETYEEWEALGKNVLAYMEIEDIKRELGAGRGMDIGVVFDEERRAAFRRKVYRDDSSTLSFLGDYYLNWSNIKAAYEAGNRLALGGQVLKAAWNLKGLAVAVLGVDGIMELSGGLGTGLAVVERVQRVDAMYEAQGVLLEQIPFIGPLEQWAGGWWAPYARYLRTRAAGVAVDAVDVANALRGANAAVRRGRYVRYQLGAGLLGLDADPAQAAGAALAAAPVARNTWGDYIAEKVWQTSKILGPYGRVIAYGSVSVSVALKRARQEPLADLRAFLESNPLDEAKSWKNDMLKADEIKHKEPFVLSNKEKKKANKEIKEAAKAKVDAATAAVSAAPAGPQKNAAKAALTAAKKELADANAAVQRQKELYTAENRKYLAYHKDVKNGLDSMVKTWRQARNGIRQPDGTVQGGLKPLLDELRKVKAGEDLGLLSDIRHSLYFARDAFVKKSASEEVVKLCEIIAAFEAMQNERYADVWDRTIAEMQAKRQQLPAALSFPDPRSMAVDLTDPPDEDGDSEDEDDEEGGEDGIEDEGEDDAPDVEVVPPGPGMV